MADDTKEAERRLRAFQVIRCNTPEELGAAIRDGWTMTPMHPTTPNVFDFPAYGCKAVPLVRRAADGETGG